MENSGKNGWPFISNGVLAGGTTTFYCPESSHCNIIQPVTCPFPTAASPTEILDNFTDRDLVSCGAVCYPWDFACSEAEVEDDTQICVMLDDPSRQLDGKASTGTIATTDTTTSTTTLETMMSISTTDSKSGESSASTTPESLTLTTNTEVPPTVQPTSTEATGSSKRPEPKSGHESHFSDPETYIATDMTYNIYIIIGLSLCAWIWNY